MTVDCRLESVCSLRFSAFSLQPTVCFSFCLCFLQGLGAPAPVQPNPLLRVGPDESLDDGGVGLGSLANGLFVRARRRRQGIEDVNAVPTIGFAEHENRQYRGAGLRAQ